MRQRHTPLSAPVEPVNRPMSQCENQLSVLLMKYTSSEGSKILQTLKDERPRHGGTALWPFKQSDQKAKKVVVNLMSAGNYLEGHFDVWRIKSDTSGSSPTWADTTRRDDKEKKGSTKRNGATKEVKTSERDRSDGEGEQTVQRERERGGSGLICTRLLSKESRLITGWTGQAQAAHVKKDRATY